MLLFPCLQEIKQDYEISEGNRNKWIHKSEFYSVTSSSSFVKYLINALEPQKVDWELFSPQKVD